jgi:hypothetical protein
MIKDYFIGMYQAKEVMPVPSSNVGVFFHQSQPLTVSWFPIQTKVKDGLQRIIKARGKFG